MAGIKISEMPVAGPLSGDEVFEIVQSGQNKKLRVSDIVSTGGSGDVESVNGKTGVVVLTAEDLNAIPNSEKGVAGGVSTLDSMGLVPEAQLPSIAITEVFVVDSEAAMLGLTAEQGTVAIRSDLSSTFILKSGEASVLSNWQELPTPTETQVLSVNGKTGVITLSAEDLSALSESDKGVANGVASLGSDGKVPVEQLPEIGAVKSVNGYEGDIELSAEDVEAVASAEKGVAEGVATLDTEGKVTKTQLPYSVSLSGSKSAFPGDTVTFTITDYSSYSEYSVSVDKGTVTQTGEVISVNVPLDIAGDITLLVSRDGVEFSFKITVQEPGIVDPAITYPASGQTGVLPQPTITANSFKTDPVDTDTHYATDWQVATDAGFTNIVAQSLNDTVNLTSWKVSSQLELGTTHFARVRYIGTNYGASEYSSAVSFMSIDKNAAPTIIEPVDGEEMVGENPTITASEFSSAVEETHEASDWEVRLASDNSIVWQSLNDTDNLVSITVPKGNLEESTQYIVRVRYIGSVLGASQWASVQFTTDESFGLKAGDPLGGGYYAGANIIVDGKEYQVVVAPRSQGGEASSTLTWKTSQSTTNGTDSTNDGRSNTLAMISAGASEHPAAEFCNNLDINGYTDWHLPSADELEICYRYLKPTTQSNDTTSRTLHDAINGTNPNSNPVGDSYTSSNPSQTSVAIFQGGGDETFSAQYYWSSTQNSSTHAWYQNFPNGGQFTRGKTPSNYVRAVRWVEV